MQDKRMMIWGLRNKRSKSGRIYDCFRNTKTPKLELWLSILEQNKSWSTRYLVCKYMYVYIYCIYIYGCVHTYVFPHLKGEWTFLPLYKEGLKSPFCGWGHSDTKDATVILGQTAPVIALAGESQGLCSRLGAERCASAEGLSSAEHGYSLQTEPSSIC